MIVNSASFDALGYFLRTSLGAVYDVDSRIAHQNVNPQDPKNYIAKATLI